MKCPVCNREMESGQLRAERRVGWYQDPDTPSFSPMEGDLCIFPGKKWWYPVYQNDFDAFICKDCKMICFDYGNKTTIKGKL